MSRSLILLSVFAVITTDTGNAQTPTPRPTAEAPRHIMLPNRKDTLPFSDAVLVGDTLYLAGRIGVDPETGKPPAELEKEIHLLFDGMKTTLAAANMTMDDLVSVQVFCPDLSLYEKSTRSTGHTSSKISPRAPSSAPDRSCVEDASRFRGSRSGAELLFPLRAHDEWAREPHRGE